MSVIKCVWKFWWDDDVIGMGSGGVVDAVVGDGEPEVGGGAKELGRQPGGGGGACLQGGQHGGRLQVGLFWRFNRNMLLWFFVSRKEPAMLILFSTTIRNWGVGFASIVINIQHEW